VRDIATSRAGYRGLAGFFGLFVLFLYAPIVILVIFSFNDNFLPTFPLKGFTLQWYGDFFHNPELRRALTTSAEVAAISSAIAVALGIVASIVLVRRRFFGKPAASALLLSPLVIPYVVFGIALLLFFQAWHVPLGIQSIVIGHVVLAIPYTILVLIPRLERIDVRLEEAARDLGASGWRTFRSITFPLIVPAVVSAFIVAFTLSFDEFAVAQFVNGDATTFPIYLFSQLRFPNKLPSVIAVAVVVMTLSILVVLVSEVGRRIAERRIGGEEPVFDPAA
jgi:spermidine/putrescine transport system permease protein